MLVVPHNDPLVNYAGSSHGTRSQAFLSHCYSWHYNKKQAKVTLVSISFYLSLKHTIYDNQDFDK